VKDFESGIMRKSLTLFVQPTKARRATCFNYPQMSDLPSAHNRAASQKELSLA